jgi:hypothetical protein
VNAPTTCTITVADTDDGTPVTPTGTVSWSSDAAGSFSDSESCTLDGTAKCSVSYTPDPGSEGDHGITADYDGDTDHDTTEGGTTVTATKRSTSTSVECSPTSVAVNVATSCTATVTDTSDGTGLTPGGTVSWTTDSTGTFSGSGSCTLDGTGTCTVTYTPAAGTEGPHEVKATYGGDDDHTGSSGTSTITATQRASSTGVACSPNPATLGGSTTCTATVKDTSGGTALTPSGSVTWASDKAGTFGGGGSCSVSGSGDTATCSVTYTPGVVGAATITATYAGDTDHVGSNGNTSLSTIYSWTGFFQPVDNLPTINSVKAGSAVPVKFSLGGNQGLGIVAAGYPTSNVADCAATATDDPVEQTVTAGSSSLTYDASANQYVYVWKTDKAWAGTCRRLTVTLAGGSTREALFTFAK